MVLVPLKQRTQDSPTKHHLLNQRCQQTHHYIPQAVTHQLFQAILHQVRQFGHHLLQPHRWNDTSHRRHCRPEQHQPRARTYPGSANHCPLGGQEQYQPQHVKYYQRTNHELSTHDTAIPQKLVPHQLGNCRHHYLQGSKQHGINNRILHILVLFGYLFKYISNKYFVFLYLTC